ncbi:BTAD domain-containing putative transcriptional regulator [Bailinhaonella thermotolerans]|uniref:Transcriptional regulator n=1 Tax=Bailinhaonella thermotolerans TaxID=1070861 RepID=A0A3A4AYD0_9ACTN|nr:BTAD domain-containing putative transcriptional regulator [Bailinhaonella thermotolerans]RJL32506.1 transcriptional regulator [Bailinhaonella thermotolerans]
MDLALTLLDGVRWRGGRVVGERARTLLAVLALHGPAGASDERLVEELWHDEPPANPTKALQVVVSRTRAATGADAVVRTARGYRLGLAEDQVDLWLLGALVRQARDALGEGDSGLARRRAEEALRLVPAGAEDAPEAPDGPHAVAAEHAAGHAAAARRVLGLALGSEGEHEAALPLLEEAVAARPRDEETVVRLLRSEAAVRGAAAALERYERYRAGLAEDLGADPGPELARVHAELLVADRPVREGVLYDGSSLLGRDEDVRAVRALMQSARVVSIVGPGGLGKTRLAHVVGRRAPQPVVHFVELVGVSSPEGVIGEVGSALGVRDSVSARRTLTPEQRADIRSRIARQLDQVPALLILDNCEHVIGAVADLVAFVTATTRDARVLTTSRAPLSIPAERVYPLGELSPADAVELFRQRATAARPGARIDEGVAAEIVSRLDGLPLAIELAAAKVRVMSAEEINRRLADRFTLLRGGNRTAPDRHRTLLAVIDWSWNLLEEPARRALRWLSLFGDGFTLEAAERVLGPDALPAVHALAEQSLLSVRETPYGLRYRMLETVREFGRLRLREAGEEDAARAAVRAWATEYAAENAAVLFGPDQFAAVDALRAEDGNLADLLRQALAGADPETAVRLMAGLGGLWSVRGDHARILALREGFARVVAGWRPPPELEEAARVALLIVIMNNVTIGDNSDDLLRGLLRDLPIRETTDPRLAGLAQVVLTIDPSGRGGGHERLEELAGSADRDVALMATLSSASVLENAGDMAAAVAAAERGLEIVREDDGPWMSATLHTILSQLAIRLGDHARAVRHARAALPTLSRIGATDDETQIRSVLLFAALAAGDQEAAEAELAEIIKLSDSPLLSGLTILPLCAAELALARGDTAAALAEFRQGVRRARELRLPGVPATDYNPWVVMAEAVALTAHAHHGGPRDLAPGEELFRLAVTARLKALLSVENPYLDYPVCGTALFAVGSWSLLRGAWDPRDAVRLLVLAERFAYNRSTPVMAFERIEPYAEAAAPGVIAAVRAEYGDRRPPDLLGEARDLAERLSREYREPAERREHREEREHGGRQGGRD